MKHRFFYEGNFFPGQEVVLHPQSDANEFKHLKKVLRLLPGDMVYLNNGRGLEAKSRIHSVSNESIVLSVANVSSLPAPVCAIQLFQGVLKGQRMDWAVEKLTELGLGGFFPLLTKFSNMGERDCEKRRSRWKRLSRAALKQSGGGFLPKVHSPRKLERCLTEEIPPHTACFFLNPGPKTLLSSLLELRAIPKSIYLLVGPEGGFHPEEVVGLEEKGFCSASLGGSVLRGETAGLLAVGIVHQWIAMRG